MTHIIKQIEAGSIAEELGIKPGDILLGINGSVKDVFDYRLFLCREELNIVISSQGTETEYEIEKDYDDDLGLIFETELMDEIKACENNCIFCFMAQLPKNMRSTLYFKDDDMRMSFLFGNYVTLTNITSEELTRIISLKLSPVNISVHTTDPGLRIKMMRNKNAGDILEKIKLLADNGISLNFQVVLCKGINDGANLDKTIDDLSKFIPAANSLSVVPAGLTAHREGLFRLEPFDASESLEIIKQIEWWQKRLLVEYGTRFVYAADEFYVSAEREIPPYDEYEDFPQLENGVGMLSLAQSEFDEALEAMTALALHKPKTVIIVCGEAAYKFFKDIVPKVEAIIKELKIKVIAPKNSYFGELITVSGLLTGIDIYNRLKNEELGDIVFIPQAALKCGEDIFLDDMTLCELEEKLGVPVIPASSIKDFFEKLLL